MPFIAVKHDRMPLVKRWSCGRSAGLSLILLSSFEVAVATASLCSGESNDPRTLLLMPGRTPQLHGKDREELDSYQQSHHATMQLRPRDVESLKTRDPSLENEVKRMWLRCPQSLTTPSFYTPALSRVTSRVCHATLNGEIFFGTSVQPVSA